MVTKPIQYKDLSYQAYKRIREMILSGEFKAGEKIPQERIAEMLGVSRMPLHKAFQMLEDEYLVESIPRRGIFVKKPDLVSIMEAFECREGLEGLAARRAALSLNSKQIGALEKLFSPFHDLRNLDEIKYQKADQKFHETIIRSSGNMILQRLNSIGNVLIKTYPKGIILPYEESMNDHRLIIGALKEKAADRAEELVRQHSRKARNLIAKQIEQLNKNR
jgi:DNA-binding GntR family transcriptional regulator